MSGAGPARAVDFAALVPRDWHHVGFSVHVGRGVQLSGSASFFTAEVRRRRLNPQGRELKGEHVVTLCGDPGAPLGELLRTLAGLFEADQPVEIDDPVGAEP